MTQPQLTPFQEKLVRLRLSGMTLSQVSRQTGRRYGTVRNDFSRIYEILNIHLLCELGAAFTSYELSHSRFSVTMQETKQLLERTDTSQKKNSTEG